MSWRPLALIALACATTALVAQGCGPKCANEGRSCGDACQIGSIICQAGQSVCATYARGADGTFCGGSSVCKDGFCRSSCEAADCKPANACRVGQPECGRNLFLGCLDTGAPRADGTPCGTAGACARGFCSCSREGSDAGCSASTVCDRLDDGTLGCQQRCDPSHSACEVAVCAPAFDGGSYVGSRCDYRLDGGSAGADCTASSACRRDHACISGPDGGTCRRYCTRDANPAIGCPIGYCITFSGTLGTCQP